ncbi:hypothetical protein [Raoultibacter phocaeensis]|uniref:hypothetical protein n=1 Tax=Raoultibacter phocaeensis TaxID=2479841 RepID=UPI001118BACE|nr:hypothetical protein [Raoultibacter phocaeensis]
MSKLKLLLKVQLLGTFGINKALHADKAKAKRTIGLFVLAALAIGALCVGYSVGAAYGLAEFGLVDSIPFVAVLVGSLAGAVAAFLKANGVLFGFKDYDLVMSLPVTASAVVLSRLAALYALSLVFGAVAMLPAFGVYASLAHVTFGSVVMMVASVFLAPLLPMTLAILLAVGISALAARMRHANIVTVVLSIAAVLVIVVVPYAMMGSTGGDDAAITALAAQQLVAMEAVLPPIAWASAGITNGDALVFLLFAAVSVVPAIAAIALVSRRFAAINTLLMAHRPNGSFSFAGKDGEARLLKVRKPLAALLAKEAARLVSTPIYLMNACIGYVLVLVAGIAAIAASVLGMLPADLFGGEIGSLIGAFLPWAMAFFIGISSTTAASVSLEGKSRWLMYTAPVPARTILGAKALLSLVIGLPVVSVSGMLLAIAFGVDFASGILCVAVPAAVSVFVTMFGLMIDARRPRYDWKSEYEPVKRSVAVMATVLLGFAIVVVGMLATAFLGAIGGIMLAVVLVVSAWLMFRNLSAVPLRE